MNSIRKFAFAAAMLSSTAIHAQESIPDLMKRDSVLPPVLVWLQEQGSKLTYLGDDSGLKGYLVEAPSGKMQSVYVAPDGKHVVIGILFEKGGKNVTGIQIGEMKQRLEEAAGMVGGDQNATPIRQTISGDKKPSATAKDAKPEGDKAAEKEDPEPAAAAETKTAAAEPAAKAAAQPKSDTKAAADIPAAAVESTAVADGLLLPDADRSVEGATGSPSDPFISEMSRDDFLAATKDLPYFDVGSRNAPATVWFVADPQCPYCHAAWSQISPLVFANKVKARMILINALEGSEVLVRQVLSSENPSRLWIDSRAGTDLKGMHLQTRTDTTQWAQAGNFMTINMGFAAKFKINKTPFLAYVAPDGRFYSSLGVPTSMDAFLAASGVVDIKKKQ